MLLENKVILVAGAAGLLGSRVVEQLLQHGAQVIATDLTRERLEQQLGQLGVDTASADISIRGLNLLDKQEVIAFFQSLGTLDGAVNCSYPRNKHYGKHFYDVDVDSFNDNVAMHLGSAFLFTQQCAAHFERQQHPLSLVNMSSIYGVVAPKFDVYDHTNMTMPVEYAAIKSAIQHISRYASAYVDNSQFRVNCVSPGGILDGQPSDFVKAYQSYTHGTGMLDSKDVVGPIVYLLSDLSNHMTGQNLILDDGFTL
ncbi:oxidoreductase [Alteromonas sp. D210916BOD_24]|uniref:oxidoreductase n=1 Tax=Alteromonas sp. D210916BOD_24 TaxID=3157618 RepID=UPI00399C8144